MNEILIALLRNLPFPIWVKDLDLNFIFVNEEYAKMYNKLEEDFIGLKNEDLFDKVSCEIYNNHCRGVIDELEPRTVERNINNIFRHCYIFPILDEEENICGIAGIIDVTSIGKIREKNNEIEIQKNLTKQIIDILPGVIFYKDKDSRYIYANKECTDFYKERGIDDIIGKTDFELNPDKDLANKFLIDDRMIIETKKPIYNEAIIVGKNGEKEYREVVKMPLIDSMGNVSGIVGRSINITEKKLTQERLKYLSYTDILTGLKNRTSFEERIQELACEKYLPLGVIMGDANGLKIINDSLGHEEGDKLLKLTSKVLKNVCEDIGEIFRIGGDEFVILVPNSSEELCNKLIKSINKKCIEHKHSLFELSISLGVSVRKDKVKNIYEVLKEAEDKMYINKQLHKNKVV
ncbi:MAG: sensor domain-containing diguanylate cyclase [Peptostreptococcaceae bacterium]